MLRTPGSHYRHFNIMTGLTNQRLVFSDWKIQHTRLHICLFFPWVEILNWEQSPVVWWELSQICKAGHNLNFPLPRVFIQLWAVDRPEPSPPPWTEKWEVGPNLRHQFLPNNSQQMFRFSSGNRNRNINPPCLLHYLGLKFLLETKWVDVLGLEHLIGVIRS